MSPNDYHREAEDIAASLGTKIPSEIDRHMWSLPILREFARRLAELTAEIEKMKGQA